MEPTRLRIGDAELVAYRSAGAKPSATAAVLLHGIGMTHRTFEQVQPMLASLMPVVSFDLPGFGTNPRPPRTYGVPEHAAVVNAALDLLGVGRVIVVGHSMGAQVAVELAASRPGRTASTVLVGPVVDDQRRTVAAQAGDLGLDTLQEPPRVNARVLVDYLRGGVPWYLQNLERMFAYDIEQAVRGVRCPVTVVRGERDPVAREPWCRRLAAAAGGPSRLVTVPRCGHVVPLTGAAALTGIVADLNRE